MFKFLIVVALLFIAAAAVVVDVSAAGGGTRTQTWRYCDNSTITCKESSLTFEDCMLENYCSAPNQLFANDLTLTGVMVRASTGFSNWQSSSPTAITVTVTDTDFAAQSVFSPQDCAAGETPTILTIKVPDATTKNVTVTFDQVYIAASACGGAIVIESDYPVLLDMTFSRSTFENVTLIVRAATVAGSAIKLSPSTTWTTPRFDINVTVISVDVSGGSSLEMMQSSSSSSSSVLKLVADPSSFWNIIINNNATTFFACTDSFLKLPQGAHFAADTGDFSFTRCNITSESKNTNVVPIKFWSNNDDPSSSSSAVSGQQLSVKLVNTSLRRATLNLRRFGVQSLALTNVDWRGGGITYEMVEMFEQQQNRIIQLATFIDINMSTVQLTTDGPDASDTGLMLPETSTKCASSSSLPLSVNATFGMSISIDDSAWSYIKFRGSSLCVFGNASSNSPTTGAGKIQLSVKRSRSYQVTVNLQGYQYPDTPLIANFSDFSVSGGGGAANDNIELQMWTGFTAPRADINVERCKHFSVNCQVPGTQCDVNVSVTKYFIADTTMYFFPQGLPCGFGECNVTFDGDVPVMDWNSLRMSSVRPPASASASLENNSTRIVSLDFLPGTTVLQKASGGIRVGWASDNANNNNNVHTLLWRMSGVTMHSIGSVDFAVNVVKVARVEILAASVIHSNSSFVLAQSSCENDIASSSSSSPPPVFDFFIEQSTIIQGQTSDGLIQDKMKLAQSATRSIGTFDCSFTRISATVVRSYIEGNRVSASARRALLLYRHKLSSGTRSWRLLLTDRTTVTGSLTELASTNVDPTGAISEDAAFFAVQQNSTITQECARPSALFGQQKTNFGNSLFEGFPSSNKSNPSVMLSSGASVSITCADSFALTSGSIPHSVNITDASIFINATGDPALSAASSSNIKVFAVSNAIFSSEALTSATMILRSTISILLDSAAATAASSTSGRASFFDLTSSSFLKLSAISVSIEEDSVVSIRSVGTGTASQQDSVSLLEKSTTTSTLSPVSSEPVFYKVRVSGASTVRIEAGETSRAANVHFVFLFDNNAHQDILIEASSTVAVTSGIDGTAFVYKFLEVVAPVLYRVRLQITSMSRVVLRGQGAHGTSQLCHIAASLFDPSNQKFGGGVFLSLNNSVIDQIQGFKTSPSFTFGLGEVRAPAVDDFTTGIFIGPNLTVHSNTTMQSGSIVGSDLFTIIAEQVLAPASFTDKKLRVAISDLRGVVEAAGPALIRFHGSNINASFEDVSDLKIVGTSPSDVMATSFFTSAARNITLTLRNNLEILLVGRMNLRFAQFFSSAAVAVSLLIESTHVQLDCKKGEQCRPVVVAASDLVLKGSDFKIAGGSSFFSNSKGLDMFMVLLLIDASCTTSDPHLITRGNNIGSFFQVSEFVTFTATYDYATRLTGGGGSSKTLSAVRAQSSGADCFSVRFYDSSIKQYPWTPKIALQQADVLLTNLVFMSSSKLSYVKFQTTTVETPQKFIAFYSTMSILPQLFVHRDVFNFSGPALYSELLNCSSFFCPSNTSVLENSFNNAGGSAGFQIYKAPKLSDSTYSTYLHCNTMNGAPFTPNITGWTSSVIVVPCAKFSTTLAATTSSTTTTPIMTSTTTTPPTTSAANTTTSAPPLTAPPPIFISTTGSVPTTTTKVPVPTKSPAVIKAKKTEQDASATAATSGIATSTIFGNVGPTMATVASRVGIMNRLVACEPSFDTELPFYLSPTRLALDVGPDVHASKVRYYVGANIANMAIIFGLLFLSFLVACCHHLCFANTTSSSSSSARPAEQQQQQQQSGSSRDRRGGGPNTTRSTITDRTGFLNLALRSMGTARFPGTMTFPLLFFMQSFVGNSIMCIGYGGTYPALVGVGTLVVAMSMFGIILIAVGRVEGFNCTYRTIDQIKQHELEMAAKRKAREATFGKKAVEDDYPSKGCLSKFDKVWAQYFEGIRGKWYDIPTDFEYMNWQEREQLTIRQLEGSSNGGAASSSSSSSSWYLKRHGASFDNFKGTTKWFVIVELSMSLFLGLLDGLLERMGCHNGVYILVIIFAVYVISVFVLKPYSTRFHMWFAGTITLLQCAAAVATVVPREPPFTQELAEKTILIMATVALFLAVLQAAMLLLQDTTRWISDTLQKDAIAKREKQTERDASGGDGDSNAVPLVERPRGGGGGGVGGGGGGVVDVADGGGVPRQRAMSRVFEQAASFDAVMGGAGGNKNTSATPPAVTPSASSIVGESYASPQIVLSQGPYVTPPASDAGDARSLASGRSGGGQSSQQNSRSHHHNNNNNNNRSGRNLKSDGEARIAAAQARVRHNSMRMAATASSSSSAATTQQQDGEPSASGGGGGGGGDFFGVGGDLNRTSSSASLANATPYQSGVLLPTPPQAVGSTSRQILPASRTNQRQHENDGDDDKNNDDIDNSNNPLQTASSISLAPAAHVVSSSSASSGAGHAALTIPNPAMPQLPVGGGASASSPTRSSAPSSPGSVAGTGGGKHRKMTRSELEEMDEL